MAPTPRPWRFWIDQGGTFTDIVATAPDGTRHVHKLLSQNPGRYRHAPIQGMRHLMGLAPDAPLPPGSVEVVRMGTTIATNALLERRGEPLALLITEGFEDLLEIGYQERPDIFALRIEKPEALPARVVGVRERRGADGAVVRPLDEAHARAALAEVAAAGIRSVAVCLLHAYRAPEHEERLGAMARELGFEEVSLSHQVAREMKVVGRGDTTCVDAYLTPLIRRYLDEVGGELPAGARLYLMQSSGGLAEARAFSGKNAVLSGPAGGLVACGRLAVESGLGKVIGFDMGGTSTDVSRVDGAFDRVFETKVAGVRLKAPMLDIRTVAAGGGSLLRFESGRFLVGPRSAGADPGPAGYRRGGPLAVTDANLVLGRLQPRHFPACFGPGADEPLSLEAARAAMAPLAEAAREATGRAWSLEEVAAGFVRVANEAMAKPIKEISVARGYDVRDYALLAFGGAAAQHACALADSLGMTQVLVHPLAGVLSAYGMGLADVTREESRAALRPLDDGAPAALEPLFEELEQTCRAQLAGQVEDPAAIELQRSLDLRYRGVDQTVNLPLSSWPALRGDFEALHQQLYGYLEPETPLEIETVRVTGLYRSAPDPEPSHPEAGRPLGDDDALEVVSTWFRDPEGRLAGRPTPVFRRELLLPGASLAGPALVIDPVSTVVVDPGWGARLTGKGHLILERVERRGQVRVSTARDPVTLELFHSLFMSCAEQMGSMLERVSHSTNIKERLDFSCALFDASGALIANAPHIPVHLGAMAATVEAVLDEVRGTMAPGDVFVSNDPYRGGSHLPDVTVVTPVFSADGSLRFVVASRGHHADIGGITPGSMPPFSRSIDEEGIRLHAFPLVRGGSFQEAAIRAALAAGPYPARNLPERLSDLRAQVAANHCGVRILGQLEERYGAAVLDAYMAHILDNGEEVIRELLTAMPDGTRDFFDHLDDGARIQLRVTVAGDRATLDFAGTSAQVAGNLNAPRAVVQAAVLYVFRCLTSRDIPLNSGCLRPLTLRIPEGSLLDPRPPAAVVGGNVETSQRVVDVVFGALGKLAASQGTMNNLTFGTPRYGYYETICGGAGAGYGFDGASGVHTHMTNTRITDPEVLEFRYPVRLRRFGLRRHSGGQGSFRGGDGVVRELEFLEPMTVSLLSERRALAPFGLHGGGAGRRAHNSLVRGAQTIELPAKVRLDVQAGDRLRVVTPGGGGYEPTAAEWASMEPAMVRGLCRRGRLRRPTCGVAAGHVQANLIVLPAAQAGAFERFCRANPQACPLLERLPVGDARTRVLAAGADVRSDLPGYLVHRPGGVDALDDITPFWTQDAVAFLLGCSFSFEGALAAAGHALRHVDEGRNVPMYRTGRPLVPEGPFGGQLVVSMRPYRPEEVEAVTALTAAFPRTHGAPVFHGDPADLGIADLARPDWGDAVTVRPGEVPVFWACGVTSQEACAAALAAGALPWYLSHAPGHMFVGDLRDEELRGPG